MASPNADRHLLFGLIALQNGLIQPPQLMAAFHAWTSDKCRPLAEHLVALGHLNDAQRPVVEAMAALHLEAHGRDPEKSLAAIPAGPATRASLAALADPDIEATLGRIGLAHPPTRSEDEDPDRTASIAVGSPTSAGQRFRIVRPHARGGLGAVFVALDAELHREVALKQILEQHADDPFSRQRFIAEAEITGGLEHPGIVPVYGLGADPRGRPYYAMRFIKGDSLKEAIARFHDDEAPRGTGFRRVNQPDTAGMAVPRKGRDPGRRSLELRELLRRFIDVCNAIEYAHSRGVIHRDLKPANIIVGKHGETLVVDWGLAKSVGRADPSVGEQTIAPASSGSSETLPGSALGTPAYMSPEQARGELDRLGPRSDVYSLGATLYCLLTGKPPYEGDDVGEVLRMVQRGQFTAPRRLDPSIDPALEAVCLKAMALEAGDRYASGRALADDVKRWMADEPVSAWAEPWTRRLSRWMARHRTGMTGAAAALLAGVVGLFAVLGVQSAANARLSESLRRETDANAELTRSRAAVQARYDLAVEAVRALHTGVSEDFLLREERFKEHSDRLLKTASEFYGKLGTLLDQGTDVASRRALGQANFELAELTGKVGRQEDALAAHRSVLAAREALAAEPGADIGMKADVGRSLNAIAHLLGSTGKTGEALAAYRRSESLLTHPAGSDRSAKAALADCRSQIGLLLFRIGKTDEALAAYRQARADQEALAAATRASGDARRDLAATVDRIGHLLWNTGKLSEAEAEYRTALAIRQEQADDNPAATELRSSLALSHLHVGNMLWYTGKPTEAEAEHRTALALYQKLADENPAVTLFRRNVANSREWLGGLLLTAAGKPAEAEAECRTGIAIMQKLVDENPAVTDFRGLLAIGHRNLGILLLQMGRPSAAEAECRTAVAIQQRLVDENPTDSSFRDNLAYALNHLGDVARSLGRAAQAKGFFERGIALEEPQFHADPTDLMHRSILSCLIRRRGLTLGDPAGAAADARRALALCDGLPAGSVWTMFETACCHAALAGLAGQAGSGVSAAEGEEEAASAVEWLRRAAAMGYRNANEIRIESALGPLRSRDDFQALMMDLSFPDDPFATGR